MPGYAAYRPVSTSSHLGPPYPRRFWIRRLAALIVLTVVVPAGGLWLYQGLTRDSQWLPDCPFATAVSSTFVDDGPTAAQTAQRLADGQHHLRPLTNRIVAATKQARASGSVFVGQTQQVVPCKPNK